ncbi:MAG: DUF1684 domain-containing protein [Taibaiella sp.]|nr:DUF1684 domain-containing protein [Taibaiella sp.]
MRRSAVLYLALLLSAASTYAQDKTYATQIAKHRQQYKQEFIEDKRSPLKADDTANLRFFSPDGRYQVKAKVILTPEAEPFDMPTVSGKTKKYRQYGWLTFKINDTAVRLQVFQSLKLIEDPKYKDHLFVPFTDGTTYTETYGGGRYLDLSLLDISNGFIELDFNKCYNPWCAYASGYSCPIPPVENRMPVSIRAGEMNYAGAAEH